MKAAILTELNKELIIDNIEENTGPLEPGQVLVDIEYSGLCGAQLQEIAGKKNNAKFLPHLIGHEGVGIVRQVSLGVNKVLPGDKVIFHWRKGSGIDAAFPQYLWNGRIITGGKITTLCSSSIVSENRLTKIPPESDSIIATLLGCSLSTAFGIINNDARIGIGDNVLIIGFGGVGMQLTSGCFYAGANSVFIVEQSSSKHDMILKYGACPVKGSFDKKVDCIIDTTGRMDIISNYIINLADGGRVVIVSQPQNDLSFSFPADLFSDSGKQIIFTQGGGISPDRDLSKFLEYTKKIKYSPSVEYYPLSDINKAITHLKSGNATRIIIDTK